MLIKYFLFVIVHENLLAVKNFRILMPAIQIQDDYATNCESIRVSVIH